MEGWGGEDERKNGLIHFGLLCYHHGVGAVERKSFTLFHVPSMYLKCSDRYILRSLRVSCAIMNVYIFSCYWEMKAPFMASYMPTATEASAHCRNDKSSICQSISDARLVHLRFRNIKFNLISGQTDVCAYDSITCAVHPKPGRKCERTPRVYGYGHSEFFINFILVFLSAFGHVYNPVCKWIWRPWIVCAIPTTNAIRRNWRATCPRIVLAENYFPTTFTTFWFEEKSPTWRTYAAFV